MRWRNPIIPVLLVLAVLAAEVTCTCGAGFRLTASNGKAADCPMCCAAKHHSPASKSNGGSPCPHCCGGTIAEHVVASDLAALAPASMIAFEGLPTAIIFAPGSLSLYRQPHGLSPPIGSPSLLHLFCSLVV